MLAVCDFCPPKAPNPPKSLRHRHFYAGGLGGRHQPAHQPARLNLLELLGLGG
jgi:hypothetical protein